MYRWWYCPCSEVTRTLFVNGENNWQKSNKVFKSFSFKVSSIQILMQQTLSFIRSTLNGYIDKIDSKAYLHHFFEPQVFLSPKEKIFVEKSLSNKKILRKSMDSVTHLRFAFLLRNHLNHSMFVLPNFSQVSLTQKKSLNTETF